jgi:type IV pilus assembly protein PilN
MNINLNLATRPYIELRSVYARLRILAVILAVIALPMFLVMHLEETMAAAAQARVAQLQQNIETLREQQAHARALVLEGPNAATIREIDFLNRTFRQKSFSWTATMVDLETVLPYGVAVRGIEPLLAPDGHVLIRLRVDGPREQAIAVIRNLEHSRHFVAPRLVQETEVTDQNKQGNRLQPVNTSLPSAAPLVRFDILSDYRPLPNSHDSAGVRAAKAEQADAGNPAIPSVSAVRTAHRRMHLHVAAKPAPGAAIQPAGGAR